MFEPISATIHNRPEPQIEQIDEALGIGSPQNSETTKNDDTGERIEAFRKQQQEAILKVFPPRFKITNFDTETAAKLERGQSFLFTGPVGTGKTHKLLEVMAGWILEDCIAKSWMVVREIKQPWIFNHFMTVSDALRRIKLSFDRSGEVDVAEQMVNAKVLFLDDLGVEKTSDWTREVFFNVINERYTWMRPMLITTNLTMQEIAKVYGDRMASRLVEMCEIRKFAGPDRRLKGRS